ncbi:hypothetical protein [Streptomyces sp. NPDC048172]|uniref:hypothetical protein n=1 Tax=Streptomyces sp. NPDC048172 TaxID=3365505 RepID=UPI00371EC526
MMHYEFQAARQAETLSRAERRRLVREAEQAERAGKEGTPARAAAGRCAHDLRTA